MLDIIHDEQNGFRSGPSCADHLFLINIIIENMNIDIEKAYDFTERNLCSLQLLLSALYQWATKWRMKINVNK